MKHLAIVLGVVFLLLVYKVAFSATFAGKTQQVIDISCSGGSIFNVKKSKGENYTYPFYYSKSGINTSNKSTIGSYKKTDTTKCHKNDKDKTPVTVYIVDKIGVSR